MVQKLIIRISFISKGIEKLLNYLTFSLFVLPGHSKFYRNLCNSSLIWKYSEVEEIMIKLLLIIIGLIFLRLYFNLPVAKFDILVKAWIFFIWFEIYIWDTNFEIFRSLAIYYFDKHRARFIFAQNFKIILAACLCLNCMLCSCTQ